MPIYEYRCNVCDHQFEQRQKFSDPPASSCPKCGGAVHKMVSTVAFSLKGGGWYAEGYGAKAEAPKENDVAAGTGAAPDSAQTDSAPKESAPKETTESPATPASAPSQAEPQSTVAAKPATVEQAKAE
jgi:putative FmdB family regulatory protein